jgi:hypothetical protein
MSFEKSHPENLNPAMVHPEKFRLSQEVDP